MSWADFYNLNLKIIFSHAGALTSSYSDETTCHLSIYDWIFEFEEK